MRNPEIADAFTELADRLTLTDAKPYRYLAYRSAASTFRDLDDSVARLSQEGRLREIDGIGPAIEEKVQLLLQTGTFPALERARADVDDTLLALTTLPGVGPATARKAHAAFAGATFDDLVARASAGELTVGGGVTKKVIDGLAAIGARRASGVTEVPAGSLSGVPLDQTGAPLPGPWFRRDQAQVQLEALAALLEPHGEVAFGGDFVRGCELMRDIAVGVLAPDGVDAGKVREQVAAVLAERGFEQESSPDEETLVLVTPSGMPARVLVAAQPDAPRVLAELPGPPSWRELAEVDGADTVPVELRDAVLAGRWTIDAAPRDLVEASQLRGELHAHSTWSDGRASILDMARAARARGDEFFCVTDHSAPYAMVGGLTPERLAEQAEEIATANEQLAREHDAGEPAFRVLRGSEVEVLADGSLGLPDAALEQLDWVVASIHVSQRQAADVILDRMRRVIDNPLVDAIGHPTSRRLLVRDRTALDVDAVIELAATSGVVLEVNANPDRLDLDSEQASRALAAGVRLAVNTDAHRTSTLALREHGVVVARRAGARVRDVVNCLTADELLAGRRRNH